MGHARRIIVAVREDEQMFNVGDLEKLNRSRLIDWPVSLYYTGGPPCIEVNDRAKRAFVGMRDRRNGGSDFIWPLGGRGLLIKETVRFTPDTFRPRHSTEGF